MLSKAGVARNPRIFLHIRRSELNAELAEDAERPQRSIWTKGRLTRSEGQGQTPLRTSALSASLRFNLSSSLPRFRAVFRCPEAMSY